MRIITLISIFLIFFIEFLYAQGGGYVLNFDRSNDTVICGTDSFLDIQETLTVEAWIKGNPSQQGSSISIVIIASTNLI